jgi:ATP-dependent DNA helicase PIF1
MNLRDVSNKLIIEGDFKRALDLMLNSQDHLLITGRAGTGKSTLLGQYVNEMKDNQDQNVVVLAPTGVASLNVGGQTIHSFFGFKPNITLDQIKKASGQNKDMYKNIDVLVIDEISMVRADLLDCVDKFLRLNAKSKKKVFGGLRTIFIGDLYQLPPVVTQNETDMFKHRYQSAYFFDSDVFSNYSPISIELMKSYRQDSDLEFLEILNAIRNNTIDADKLARLNDRYRPDFRPDPGDGFITLVATNNKARQINDNYLSMLDGEEKIFLANISGDINQNAYPAPETLKLKKGAQVMLLNNDLYGRWVNGSIAKVTDIDFSGKPVVGVEFLDGDTSEVSLHRWQVFSYVYDPFERTLKHEEVGSFEQLPMMLSWAITIHKSQGKTFDKLIVDPGSQLFAPGQLYVALSRCRCLNDLILMNPVKESHIRSDWRVVKFLTEYQYSQSAKTMSHEEKLKLIHDAISLNRTLKITYLKKTDEKSTRIIKPVEVGVMNYKDYDFFGVRAIDESKNEQRTFKIERILEICLMP